ncbi:MAG: tRNA (adenosine(37)-N6)-threonylcarbamoyltransferase complex dimerization subunit type 1 TsaB [Dissulfurispiraceae bacterium]|jgi:tRNA threonylcarbamoyladenosine biosynthesis protein TsaB|nr:tRNA (adenosine(37)-N6)-threonylcarbamoyltransferase complex dimerization subunit type 1 TsaB [Dissulfurispiraceae bacterium]
MKCLGIETSTMLGGAAVVEDNRLVAEVRVNVKTTHSEGLLPVIDFMLRSAKIDLQQIDLLSISAGPGSFTGLRVGFSTIKGLAFSSNKLVATVSSLEALAWNMAFCEHQVCPIFDARKKEVYTGIYRWNGSGFDLLLPECAMSLDDLLAGIDKPTVFLGEGADLWRNIICDRLGGLALFVPPQQSVPSPANVAYLGLLKAEKGMLEESAALAPRYLRKSEAEIKQESKNR